MRILTLSQAVQGYWLHAAARRLSPNTLADYNNTFTKFQKFLKTDPPLADITPHDIERFLASFRRLKKKTVLNYHTGLSALWTWAVAEGLAGEHIPRQVKPPEPEKWEIVPYTELDMKLMLAACDRSRNYTRNGRGYPVNYTLPHRVRNRAILLTLLDTGLRASELCSLKISDVDMKNTRITVMGKGAKKRTVYFSARTGKDIWRYWLARPDGQRPNLPAFSGNADDLHLTRSGLAQLVKRIGQRAGVHSAHPHRFRHTFAINFLRNSHHGGNIYVLQRLLGHSSLKMVRIYLALAEQDSETAHKYASPVANWNI